MSSGTWVAEFADGYRSEILPQLPYWIQAVAGSLSAGLMLFIDYGYVRREFYLPERDDGTLMAHYRHHAHNDPLYLPGSERPHRLGRFHCAGRGRQQCRLRRGRLSAAGAVPDRRRLAGSIRPGAGQLTDEHGRYRLAQQVKKLMLPDQMGERFQAMLLARGLDTLTLPAELLAADQGGRL